MIRTLATCSHPHHAAAARGYLAATWRLAQAPRALSSLRSGGDESHSARSYGASPHHKRLPATGAAMLLAGLGLYYLSEQQHKPAGQEAAKAPPTSPSGKKPPAAAAGKSATPASSAAKKAGAAPALPEYSKEEVRKHTSEAAGGIWVTFKGNVYDITEFQKGHPGGTKILLAAGGPIEPFWNLYAVHKNNPEVLKLLEPLRIGTLKAADQEAGSKDLADPYAKDPERHPALKVNSAKPFNAEPPHALLVEHWVTPNELFFKRNHLPVPDIKADNYTLEVEVEGGKSIKLSLHDIKNKFTHYSVPVTLQCAGNRRTELHNVKPVKGLSWGTNAISNAVWTGVKLRDVLLLAGVRDDFENQGLLHVHFEGLDKDLTNQNYGASVPLVKAMDPRGDVLLAFQMNGQPLPRDHGFPVRVVVPGVVGARNVKWVGKIKASKTESTNFWQQRDYKSFSPAVDWNNVDFDSAPAIQESPVQSSITLVEGLEEEGDDVVVKGYAYSGGGRGVVRVDVSVDGGKTWGVARIKEGGYKHGDYTRTWSWALWEYEVPREAVEGKQELDVVAKATDTSYNVQPERIDAYWNLRGVLANSWPRVKVQLPQQQPQQHA